MPGIVIPELLSPAGSYEGLVAAIAAGADAVYFAGRRFGARQLAPNFSDEEIGHAIRYAHRHGVHAYVTVNTLVNEPEISDLCDFMIFLYESGADAVLVQDPGVASISRALVPDLPLHASTQLTIHNREGVEWAARMGFSRVVLSREMTRDEVAGCSDAAGKEGIGLEIFVHGALCFCYSGQCLFSSLTGGRSGNRGLCAQPCRKPYSLVSGAVDKYGRGYGLRQVWSGGPYPFSTRDLSLYRELESVVQLPLSALKVEGRMRSPFYTAVVTDVYRRALDKIAGGRFVPSAEDEMALALAFSRGFTGGRLTGSAHSLLLETSRPDNRGIVAGTVIRVRDGIAQVAMTPGITLSAGDGVAFAAGDARPDDGMVLSSRPHIRDGVAFIRCRFPVRAEDRMLLTRSASLQVRAGAIVKQGIPETRRIPIHCSFSLGDDAIPALRGTFRSRGRDFSVTVTGMDPMVQARHAPLTPDRIRAQLEKDAGGPFVVTIVSLDYPGGLFLPLSALNELRRSLIARAGDTRVEAGMPAGRRVKAARSLLEKMKGGISCRAARPHRQNRMEIAVYVDRPYTARAAFRAGASRVYFEGPACGWRTLCSGTPSFPDPATMLDQLGGLSRDSGGRECIWAWPRINGRSFLDFALPLLGEAREAGIEGVMLGTPAAAAAVHAQDPALALFAGAGCNFTNSHTLRVLASHFRLVTLSPELPRQDLAALFCRRSRDGPLLECLVQGNTELMVSAICISEGTSHGIPCLADSGRFTGVRDDHGRVFPVSADSGCRTQVRNAVETCLIDHIPVLLALGFDSVAIDARGRTPEYAAEVVPAYAEAIRVCLTRDPDASQIIRVQKERVRRVSQGGITAGYLGSLSPSVRAGTGRTEYLSAHDEDIQTGIP
jgi:putative protease